MQQDGRDTFRHDYLANTSISILCGRIFYLCTFDLSRIIMTLIDRANCFRRIKLNITSVKHRLISPKCAALFIMHFQRVIQIYYVPLIPRMVNRYDASRLSINIIFYLLEKCLEIRRRMLPEPCYPLIRGNFTPTASSPFSFPPSLFLHALPFTFSIRVKSIRRSTTRVSYLISRRVISSIDSAVQV